MPNIFITTPDNLVEAPLILFNIFNIPVSNTIISSFLITIFFLILFSIVTYNLNLDSKRGFIARSIYDLTKFIGSISLGDKSEKYLAIIGSLFFYILFSNILGLFPIPMPIFSGSGIHLTNFRPPTSDINITVSLALASIFFITYESIRFNGLKNYLKDFFKPLPFMLPLNIIGEVAKPFSLAVRLFGNIFSGMLIMSLIYRYMPIIVPAIFHIYFDMFAGLIQSIIFVSLTSVYISFAVEENS